MKVRVFKRADNSVIISRPSSKYLGGTFVNDTSKPIYETNEDGVETEVIASYEQKELTIDDCKFPEECSELEYMDMDSEDIPAIDNDNGTYQEMLYIESGEIKQDTSWDVMLMPSFLIKKKYINYVNGIIDTELAKDTPDVAELIRNQRKVELAKNVKSEDDDDGNLFWAQKALEGLTRADTEKPAIKAKLEAKITELEAINASNDQES